MAGEIRNEYPRIQFYSVTATPAYSKGNEQDMKNKRKKWADVIDVTWNRRRGRWRKSMCTEYRSEWETKMIIPRLCSSCPLHSTEVTPANWHSWRLQTRRDTYHVHTRTLWTAMHHIYFFFHARVHFHITKGFYSKQQSESNSCLWPCDLSATGVPASCVKIHLLLTFNQTSELPMRDGVLHEDIAYECSSLSRQMTGHSRETNKEEPTLSDTYVFHCVVSFGSGNAFVSEYEM